MPNYNGGRFIDSSICALLNSCWENKELIVVSDYQMTILIKLSENILKKIVVLYGFVKKTREFLMRLIVDHRRVLVIL